MLQEHTCASATQLRAYAHQHKHWASASYSHTTWNMMGVMCVIDVRTYTHHIRVSAQTYARTYVLTQRYQKTNQIKCNRGTRKTRNTMQCCQSNLARCNFGVTTSNPLVGLELVFPYASITLHWTSAAFKTTRHTNQKS